MPRGGEGGGGNRRYATATRRAPTIAEVGEQGEEHWLELRLKLVADAALLGFPNAGKSSLLRRISNARPKVADYPFTTIEPVLGTVESPDGTQLTVADVPGLLEGASQGVGLGDEFLAHLERARLLIHLVEAAPDAADVRRRLAAIDRELELHGGGLADRPQLIVLSKIDLIEPADRAALIAAAGAEIGLLERDRRGHPGAGRRALPPRARGRPGGDRAARGSRGARRLPRLPPAAGRAPRVSRAARRRHAAPRRPRDRGAGRGARPR